RDGRRLIVEAVIVVGGRGVAARDRGRAAVVGLGLVLGVVAVIIVGRRGGCARGRGRAAVIGSGPVLAFAVVAVFIGRDRGVASGRRAAVVSLELGLGFGDGRVDGRVFRFGFRHRGIAADCRGAAPFGFGLGLGLVAGAAVGLVCIDRRIVAGDRA